MKNLPQPLKRRVQYMALLARLKACSTQTSSRRDKTPDRDRPSIRFGPDYSVFGIVSLMSTVRCSRSPRVTATGSDLMDGASPPEEGILATTLYLPGGTSLRT